MSHEVTDYASALAFLYGRINYERIPAPAQRISPFKLDRFRTFLAALGDPQERLPAVHIAGTKGKGSTAQMVSAILVAAGLRVGLYTSPHLEKLEERFVIAGQPISADELVNWSAFLQPFVERDDREAERTGGRALTFFEVTTALAFLAFAAQKVDVAVLEVGLGGRLDSTNVCRPVVCGITSISLDHTKQLGNTLEAIAKEKAGIIKPNVPVVSGVIADGPRESIQGLAAQVGSRLWQRGSDFDFVYRATNEVMQSSVEFLPGHFDYRETISGETTFELLDLPLAMLGEHQAANAATAVALVRRLTAQGYSISEQAIRSGLASARCPARVEWILGSPSVVLDTAHNSASIQALLATLPPRETSETNASVGRATQPQVLVFSASKDKDIPPMLAQLIPRFDAVFLTRYLENPRAVAPAELHFMADEVAHRLPAEQRPIIKSLDDPRVTFQEACRWTQGTGLVVVTGSFFLAAELGALARQKVTDSLPISILP